MIQLLLNSNGYKKLFESMNFIIDQMQIYDSDMGISEDYNSLGSEITLSLNPDECECQRVKNLLIEIENLEEKISQLNAKHNEEIELLKDAHATQIVNLEENLEVLGDHCLNLSKQLTQLKNSSEEEKSMTAQTGGAPPQINMSTLIGAYRNISAAIDQKSQEHKEKVIDPLKKQLEVIETEIMKNLVANGGESVRTENGTAFRKLMKYINLKDYNIFVKTTISQGCKKLWGDAATDQLIEAITNMMLDDGPLHFLNKAIGKAPVLEYMNEHDDIPPLGIELTQEYVLGIRKPD